MTKASRKTGSVIWAVDPFEADASPLVSSVREMMDWATRAGLRVIPVYVMSLSESQMEAGEMQEIGYIERELAHYLHRFPLGGSLTPRVLVDDSARQAGAVRVLLDLAREAGTEWIVVSSHGRSGMKRLMLGSFAETLLRESACPLLFLPRRSCCPPLDLEKRRVLFPTDFSTQAGEAFAQFVPHASKQRFEIVIYHMLTFPVPSMDLGLVPAIPESFLPEQEAWARQEGERWVTKATKAGAKARFIMESADLPALTGRSVLDAATKEGARLIAMSSLSSPLARLVAGSVAHEVFRAGTYPVWLYGPQAVSGKRTTAA